MTDPTPVLPGDPVNPPAPVVPPADPPNDDPLGEGGKKALIAERNRAAAAEKEAGELRAQLKAIEDQGKTENEKLAERATTAEATAAAATQRALRLEIAADKGLTPAQAKRLVGTTKEELEADADDLLTSFPAGPPRPNNPLPDPTQGGRGGPPPSLDGQIAEAKAKGDWTRVVQLETSKLAAAAAPTT